MEIVCKHKLKHLKEKLMLHNQPSNWKKIVKIGHIQTKASHDGLKVDKIH